VMLTAAVLNSAIWIIGGAHLRQAGATTEQP
jgi:hypothetical protein